MPAMATPPSRQDIARAIARLLPGYVRVTRAVPTEPDGLRVRVYYGKEDSYVDVRKAAADVDGAVSFAGPRAAAALHRLGVVGGAPGARYDMLCAAWLATVPRTTAAAAAAVAAAAI